MMQSQLVIEALLRVLQHSIESILAASIQLSLSGGWVHIVPFQATWPSLAPPTGACGNVLCFGDSSVDN